VNARLCDLLVVFQTPTSRRRRQAKDRRIRDKLRKQQAKQDGGDSDGETKDTSATRAAAPPVPVAALARPAASQLKNKVANGVATEPVANVCVCCFVSADSMRVTRTLARRRLTNAP
jgi:hypothetical protein